MKPPGEDPADRRARIRERRLATYERREAGMEAAAGMQQDVGQVYGIANQQNRFMGKPAAKPPRAPNVMDLIKGNARA